MTDYGTIRIPREEYERHNERRQEMGLTWAAYIDGEAPALTNGAEVDVESLVSELSDELASGSSDGADLERLRDSLSVIEERTGQIQRTLEDLQR
jgi:hypothetical protein